LKLKHGHIIFTFVAGEMPLYMAIISASRYRRFTLGVGA